MNLNSPTHDIPTSRFFRVLFSCMVCLPTALAIAFLLGSDVDGHSMHRAATSLFFLGFAAPFAAAFVVIMTALLYLFDRLAWKYGAPGPRKTAAFLVVLLLSLVILRTELLASAFIVFLLLYWLMTGRVAGRQGWSLRHFWQTLWDEKVYLVAVVALLATPVYSIPRTISYSVLPFYPGVPAMRVEHENQVTRSLKRASRNFPDAQSCLKSGAQADRREDLVKMDWDRMSATQEAEVCMFRLLHSLGGVSDASDWMAAQGFRVSNSQNSETPYVTHNGYQRVSAAWSIREKGPYFPTSGLIKRIVFAIPYGMSVSATYSEDGQDLLFAKIDYSTL